MCSSPDCVCVSGRPRSLAPSHSVDRWKPGKCWPLMVHAIRGGYDGDSSVGYCAGKPWILPSAAIGSSFGTVISAPPFTFLPVSFSLFSLLSHLQPFCA